MKKIFPILLFLSVLTIFYINSGGFLKAESLSLPNEMGRIPVLEYHQIADYEARWTRKIANFKSDLEFLYNNDYFPITVKDFVSGNIKTPLGKKPVVITFDDGSQGQFNLLEDGSIDPDSAVGIMNSFCESHYDFDCTAIFFVNSVPFKQADKVEEKLNYLVDHGYEVGNHTYGHADLAKSDRINFEIGAINKRFAEWLGDKFNVDSLAYPFGAYPKDESRWESLYGGKYEGSDYQITNAFLVGAEPSFSPYNKNFNPFKIPRIQAIDDEWLRHFNRGVGVTERVKEKFTPFVSDGDINMIRVAEDQQNLLAEKFKDRLGENEGKISVLSVDLINKNEMTRLLEKKSVTFSERPADPSAEREIAFIARPISLKSSVLESPVNFYSKVFNYFQPLVKNVEIRTPPQDLAVNGQAFYYEVKPGDTYDSIAAQYLGKSSFYSVSSFAKEISQKNGNMELAVGFSLEMPGIILLSLPRNFEVNSPRGVYLTAYSVVKSGREYADQVAASGGNMIVFDVKAGRLGYKSDLKIVNEINDQSGYAYDLEEWINYLHEKGIYAVGRIVAFKDEHVAASKRDWNLKKKGTSTFWSNNEGAIWLDPSNLEVRDYLKQISIELAQKGIDEIQFDYVRFPAMGTASTFSFDGEKRGLDREQVITEFAREIKQAIEPYGTKIGVDVFGVAGWSALDASIVGQNIPELGAVVDVIYPMVYPSHFGAGYNGHVDPANEPYFFVQESTKKFQKLVGDGGAEIRPWFQGFPMGVRNFGTWYLLEQKKALNDISLDSFVVWSPGNKYSVTWPALYAADIGKQ